MEKDINTAIDANGNTFDFSKSDFSLVQNTDKIYDTKFETKVTTFTKDALKRFYKNKSSVVGAIIIGIIVLLAIFIPIFTPYDTEGVHPKETMLLPKLFNSNSGFWDGTKKINGVAYDTKNEMPIGQYTKSAIYDLKIYEENGITYCNFRYDFYEEKYGIVEMSVPNTYFNRYIKNGWCEYDAEVGISSFKRLDDRCPVIEIISYDNNKLIANVSQYRYLGYETMPKFIFGTNSNGLDLVSITFLGLRASLIFAICISIFCFLFGLVWGAVSGYFGGNVDLYMERFKDILGGVPTIVIVTLVTLHFGNGIFIFAAALCLTGWMGTASRTRTQFYRFKGREYVLASRTLGSSDKRLIFRHILPNALGTIVTSSVLMIPGIIFTESVLSYLGLSLEGETFGKILSSNQQYLSTYPMLIVVPAIIISFLMISFNLFGNGLRDALNPSLKGSE